MRRGIRHKNACSSEMMPKSQTASPTTAQSLGALLKSARDIMRKDKGLNGDLDRLPMLTWIMFLKFLDDLELQREGEAKLAGKKFKTAIEPPYRWRDWAAKSGATEEDRLKRDSIQREPQSSFPMARCLAMACARGSSKNCSRNSTCT